MKFSIKDFFSKCEQVRSFLRIWSHLLKKSSVENFIFYVVLFKQIQTYSVMLVITLSLLMILKHNIIIE